MFIGKLEDQREYIRREQLFLYSYNYGFNEDTSEICNLLKANCQLKKIYNVDTYIFIMFSIDVLYNLYL